MGQESTVRSEMKMQGWAAVQSQKSPQSARKTARTLESCEVKCSCVVRSGPRDPHSMETSFCGRKRSKRSIWYARVWEPLAQTQITTKLVPRMIYCKPLNRIVLAGHRLFMRVSSLVCLLLLATNVLAQTKLSSAEAEAALKKVAKVKPGMTLAQGWKVIGLDYRKYGGRGSGPTRRFMQNFDLSSRHRIYMEIDYTKKPPRILKVETIEFK